MNHAILNGEKLLSLSAAASKFPGHRANEKLNQATVFRWITRGLQSPAGVIRLEAARVGNRWVTSAESLGRFSRALTAAQVGGPSAPTPHQRSTAAAKAALELDALLGA